MCIETNKPDLSPKLRNLAPLQTELALEKNICKMCCSVVRSADEKGSHSSWGWILCFRLDSQSRVAYILKQDCARRVAWSMLALLKWLNWRHITFGKPDWEANRSQWIYINFAVSALITVVSNRSILYKASLHGCSQDVTKYSSYSLKDQFPELENILPPSLMLWPERFSCERMISVCCKAFAMLWPTWQWRYATVN